MRVSNTGRRDEIRRRAGLAAVVGGSRSPLSGARLERFGEPLATVALSRAAFCGCRRPEVRDASVPERARDPRLPPGSEVGTGSRAILRADRLMEATARWRRQGDPGRPSTVCRRTARPEGCGATASRSAAWMIEAPSSRRAAPRCARSRGRCGRRGGPRSRPRRRGRRAPGPPTRAGRTPSRCAPESASTPSHDRRRVSWRRMRAPRRASSATCM